MKRTKLAASLMAVSMAAATLLTGCKTDEPGNSTPTNSSTPGNTNSDTTSTAAPAPELTYADGTELRMACGYNSASTSISFDAGTAKDGITLANGKTYNAGDLKPTWVTLQEKLNIKFTDKWSGTGKSASDEFNYWKDRLSEVDMVAGSASLLTENGQDGKIVDLSKYLDSMPNFKAYLEANPIVRLSITGSTTGNNSGAIYFSPYFDGADDIERMPLMRVDWVQKLLNGPGEFTASASNQTAAPKYQPYMPTSGKVEVDIVKADGSGTKKINKDYDKAGNIIAKMNAAGAMSGVDAVNMLRKYIDEAYGGEYGENRADLFIGQNAAWDADELVALLRCVVANPQTLNGNSSAIQGLFSRQENSNQRQVDMFRFAGHLFGVRGLESRQDYLYVGNDGKLVDARQQPETYEALERMYTLTQEGLISADFVKKSEIDSAKYLETDSGFMSYDYNQTQTAYNDTKLQTGTWLTDGNGEAYMAVMPPVAKWFDGSNANGVFMRFVESWRSVKTDGWAISAAGVGNDTNKLNAALKLIDYAYSKEGQILMSYGPDEFIKMEGGKYVNFDFNGQQWPEIADATRQELKDKASGNYTNYARNYLGSTLSFLKSQSFEYQCTTELGRVGAGYISKAIGFGTIKHPLLAVNESNMWYTSVPTVLPTTKEENDEIAGYTELGSKGNFSTSNNQKNILVNLIAGGYSAMGVDGATDAKSTANVVTNTWHGKQYLEIKDGAWQALIKFYKGN